MNKTQQQAFLSGLEFTDCDNNKTSEPEWKSCDWPPLLGGSRHGHTCIVVKDPTKNQSEIVVVVGGRTKDKRTQKSVLLFNVDDEEHVKEWREGPCMNQKRCWGSPVVCNGALYVIGGLYGGNCLDTIERIHVQDLLSAKSNSASRWKTLECRLSTKRAQCGAAAVRNRFIVVAGGHTNAYNFASVEIIDTASGRDSSWPESRHSWKTAAHQAQCSITLGPSLKAVRRSTQIAVIGRRIYVVGGFNASKSRRYVEYLEFEDWVDDSSATAASVFPLSNPWKTLKDLGMDTYRGHRVAGQVGCCLVFAGGKMQKKNGSVEILTSVQVLDLERQKIWKLPKMTRVLRDSLAVTSKGVILIGGSTRTNRDSCEILSLVDKNTRLFARLLATEPFRFQI